MNLINQDWKLTNGFKYEYFYLVLIHNFYVLFNQTTFNFLTVFTWRRNYTQDGDAHVLWLVRFQRLLPESSAQIYVHAQHKHIRISHYSHRRVLEMGTIRHLTFKFYFSLAQYLDSFCSTYVQKLIIDHPLPLLFLQFLSQSF